MSISGSRGRNERGAVATPALHIGPSVLLRSGRHRADLILRCNGPRRCSGTLRLYLAGSDSTRGPLIAQASLDPLAPGHWRVVTFHLNAVGRSAFERVARGSSIPGLLVLEGNRSQSSRVTIAVART